MAGFSGVESASFFMVRWMNFSEGALRSPFIGARAGKVDSSNCQMTGRFLGRKPGCVASSVRRASSSDVRETAIFAWMSSPSTP